MFRYHASLASEPSFQLLGNLLVAHVVLVLLSPLFAFRLSLLLLCLFQHIVCRSTLALFAELLISTEHRIETHRSMRVQHILRDLLDKLDLPLAFS